MTPMNPHYVHGLIAGVAIGVVLGVAIGAFVVQWLLEPWCEAVEHRVTVSTLAFHPEEFR